ncbi:bifunctional phosphopantothenoylcysteine decarboxylase/phosphopantothenate--cysteine ligase CoaBC [bacterium]|nr:bifunctional phosphopantothenoylcysteine decarboxylase/phosphopantothenate--cysteine ligase CoaBC [bacterium]
MYKQFAGRRILVGLSGGIACYKSCDLVSRLVQAGAEVRVLMTRNACEFVAPLTLQALSGHPVYTGTFAPADPGGIDHVRLADFAELLVVIPATANILAKMAHGIADDLLSTTYISCDCPTLAVVAMNTRMYEHPATRANLELLKRRGVHLLHPESGYLACGTEGTGRLPDRERIMEKIAQVLGAAETLEGLIVLVTAGPTREALDPVRYISNPSSGRMGFALARAAVRLGAARVELITGPVSLDTPLGVERMDIVSAEQLFAAVQARAPQADIVVMAAAVGDWTPEGPQAHKIKKSSPDAELTLRLRQSPDSLAWAAQHRKSGATVVGFAVETADEERNALDKLRRKGIDLIVVNNPLEMGAGFAVQTNRVTVLDSAGARTELPLLDKDEVAARVLELAAARHAGKGKP